MSELQSHLTVMAENNIQTLKTSFYKLMIDSNLSKTILISLIDVST